MRVTFDRGVPKMAKSRRKTGMNLSKAVSQDMPAGRRRKGEKAPKKRKRGQEQPGVVITRAEKIVSDVAPPLKHHVGTQNMSLFGITTPTTTQSAANSQPTPDPNFGSLPTAVLPKPPY